MATTTVESAPTLDETAVQGLAASMRGNLIQPSDPGYDEARVIYNAMIDKHPALIAHCSNVADAPARSWSSDAVVNFTRPRRSRPERLPRASAADAYAGYGRARGHRDAAAR